MTYEYYITITFKQLKNLNSCIKWIPTPSSTLDNCVTLIYWPRAHWSTHAEQLLCTTYTVYVYRACYWQLKQFFFYSADRQTDSDGTNSKCKTKTLGPKTKTRPRLKILCRHVLTKTESIQHSKKASSTSTPINLKTSQQKLMTFICQATIFLHWRNKAEQSGGSRLNLCLWTCLFICQDDNFWMIKHKMMKLDG